MLFPELFELRTLLHCRYFEDTVAQYLAKKIFRALPTLRTEAWELNGSTTRGVPVFPDRPEPVLRTDAYLIYEMLGRAGQFWQMESALWLLVLMFIDHLGNTYNFWGSKWVKKWCLSGIKLYSIICIRVHVDKEKHTRIRFENSYMTLYSISYL